MDYTMDEVLTGIDNCTELNDMSEFLQDPAVDEALGKVIKIIAKPDVPPAVAIKIIVELQALSAKFGLQASSLTYLTKPKAGSDEYKRKAIYYSLSDNLEKLANAVKYTVK